MKPRNSNRSRDGLTLIELLVVISLIVVLVTLILVISPAISEDQRSARAADLVSGWLLQAKQRAYRDQQTRGIRLIRDADNPNWVREVMFVERPEDYVPPANQPGVYLQVPAPPVTLTALPAGVNPNATAFIHGKDLTNGNPPSANERIVDGGDYLVFDTLETIPYNSHRVYESPVGSPGYPWVRYYPPDAANGIPSGGTRIVCANSETPPRYSVINAGFPIPYLGSGYRFVRSPRALVGEANLPLPRDMIIDLELPPTPASGGTVLPALVGVAPPYPFPPVAFPDYLDILFSPRGQLEGNNALGGKVILRIRNDSRGQYDGEQLYVVVYTRTGVIAAHPVDLTGAPAALVSPYRFVRDGSSSGL